MKNLLLSIALAVGCVATGYSQVTNPPPSSINDLANQAIAAAEAAETNDLFAGSNFEVRLGGIYVQRTGEAGATIGALYWWKDSIGFGGEVIQNETAGTSAYWAEGDYRKVFGSSAIAVFGGAGYDDQRDQPMGVIGARVYYQFNKHLGTYASGGYAIEKSHTDGDRGFVAGAGLSYRF